MRFRLLLALLLVPVCVFAQDRVKVSGRIVDEQGEPVEYVQVGIPKYGFGTVSSVDGRFEIDVPADTLEFHHVSFLTGYYPVSGPRKDVMIVLKASELAPAVFIGGNTREKYLLRPGSKIMSSLGYFPIPDDSNKGRELGSLARARKPFLVKDIIFSVHENFIPGCVVAINIYRIEGEPEEFVNILHKPIYVNVALSSEAQDFDIQPEESILLEPGRYFIAFALVDCDMDAARLLQEKPGSDRDPHSLRCYFPLYFKGSYQRSVALGELKYCPFNIGIAVKGMEYQ